ncbi:MAG: O-antigen ligase family protein [Acidimicrobiales bacterium]
MAAEPQAARAQAPSAMARLGWLADRPRPYMFALVALIGAFVIGLAGASKTQLGIAALLGLALITAVLLRPIVGGLVLVGAVPALSGLAPGLPVPHLRLSEVLIGVVGLSVLASVRRREAVAWSGLDWLLLAYGAAWAIFASIDAVALHQSLTLTDWGTNLGQLQFFLIYRGVRVSVRTQGERRLAVAVLVLSAVPVALLALLQAMHVGPVVHLLSKITGGASGLVPSAGSASRATGPFANWAVLAGYLLPLLLVLWSLTLCGEPRARHRAAWVVGLVLLTALLLTEELSAIVFVLIGVVVLAASYGHRRKALRLAALAVIAGGLVAAPFLGNRLNTEFSSSAGSGRHAGVPQTIQFRWEVWSSQYIPAIQARPLEGYGATYPSTIQWPYPESQYVAYLMEGGIPVLALFAALAWAMGKASSKAARSEDPFESALGRAALVSVIAMVVMNLIWPFLSNAGLPQVLWCLLAVTVDRRAPALARYGSRASQIALNPGLAGAGGLS